MLLIIHTIYRLNCFFLSIPIAFSFFRRWNLLPWCVPPPWPFHLWHGASLFDGKTQKALCIPEWMPFQLPCLPSYDGVSHGGQTCNLPLIASGCKCLLRAQAWQIFAVSFGSSQTSLISSRAILLGLYAGVQCFSRVTSTSHCPPHCFLWSKYYAYIPLTLLLIKY